MPAPSTDPAWKDDKGMKDDGSFMKNYYPDGNPVDGGKALATFNVSRRDGRIAMRRDGPDAFPSPAPNAKGPARVCRTPPARHSICRRRPQRAGSPLAAIKKDKQASGSNGRI
jgi:hypothetical protein